MANTKLRKSMPPISKNSAALVDYMAHEINNHIHIVRGYIQYAELKKDKNSARDAFNEILASAGALCALVDKIQKKYKK